MYGCRTRRTSCSRWSISFELVTSSHRSRDDCLSSNFCMTLTHGLRSSTLNFVKQTVVGAIPSWDDLELLLAIHRQRGLQAAALYLDLDASTVRRRLRSIEDRVRFKLFENRDRHLVATSDARKLLDVAEQMDIAAIQLRRQAIEDSREVSGVVRVSTMEGFAVEYLASRLALFASIHPRLRVELVTSTRPLSLPDHETDIAINMTRPEEGALRLQLIGTFDVCLYASTAYVEMHGDPASAQDLTAHEFIGYVQELQAVDETRWLNHWVQTPKLAFVSSSLPAQLQAAISGAGIAALPVFMARNHPELLRVVTSHPPASRQWWLVTRADDKPIRRLELLCRFIGNAMRKDEGLLRLGTHSSNRTGT